MALRQQGAIAYFAQNLDPEIVGLPTNTGLHELYLAFLDFYRKTGLDPIDPIAFREWLINESDFAEALGGVAVLAEYLNIFQDIPLSTPESVSKYLQHKNNKLRQMQSLHELQLMLTKNEIKTAADTEKLTKLTDQIRNLENAIGYNPLDKLTTTQDILHHIEDLWALPDFMSTPFKSLNKALGYREDAGLARGCVYAIIAQSGKGKPLSVNTKIMMADGTHRVLKDVVPGDYVINSKGVPDLVQKVFEQGQLETLKITTNSGRQIISAFDHGFLTTNGWIQAGDLKTGSILVAPNSINGTIGTDYSNEDYRLAGYLIGDGALTSGNYNLTCFDELTLADVTFCASQKGYTLKHVTRGRYDFRVFAARYLNVSGDSHSNKIPDWIFQGSNEQIANFLGAYLATNGTVSNIKQQDHQVAPVIEYYSVNRELLRDVQRLLLKLNIPSRLSLKRGKYKNKIYLSWRLRFGSVQAVSQFTSLVRCYSTKQVLLDEWHMPKPAISTSEWVFDKIVSIEPNGFEHCRCLLIENDHTFLAEELVVHNSTLAKNMCNHFLDCGRRVLYINYEEASDHWERILLTQITKKNVYAGVDLADQIAATKILMDKFEEWGDRFMIRHDPDTSYYDDLDQWLRDILGHNEKLPDIIVIDTINSMQTKGANNKPRFGEYESMMMRLEKLAKDMNAAIIITSQENSNRAKDGREVVQQQDAGGSLTIIQKSTATIFITNQRKAGGDDSIDEMIMQLQIPKNRITGQVFTNNPPLLRYNDAIKSFEEFDIVSAQDYQEWANIDMKQLEV